LFSQLTASFKLTPSIELVIGHGIFGIGLWRDIRLGARVVMTGRLDDGVNIGPSIGPRPSIDDIPDHLPHTPYSAATLAPETHRLPRFII
jgi:hypothetical protein